MTIEKQRTMFERLVQKMEPQSRLQSFRKLKGGVSAQVTALELIQHDGLTKTLVVRQHGEADLERNPHVAADEFKLLNLLNLAGLSIPRPYYLDSSGEIFSTPVILIEYIDGQSAFSPSDLPDFIRQLADHLSRIHRVDCSPVEWSFLPKQKEIVAAKLANRPEIMDESLDEGRIREVLEWNGPIPLGNKLSLLHGDYWPGNLLWKNGQLVAVIDWEDAALGDPLSDLANARLEILWAFGLEAMIDFTEQYQSRMDSIDYKNLPLWDLYASLRPASNLSNWGLEEQAEKVMRDRHHIFVLQALEKLTV